MLAVSTHMDLTGNNTEPFNNNFLDLRINCNGTNPVAGWFAILNSTPVSFGTTPSTQQIKQSNASSKALINNTSNFYQQTLSNISGITPTSQFIAGGLGTTIGNNAILYASCEMNTLTLYPIQNGFDGTKDIIAISPKLEVTNIFSCFGSDVNLVAQLSGNNLTSTTTLTLAKLVAALASGGATSVLATTQGVSLSEDGQLAINCSSSGSSKIFLPSIKNTSGSPSPPSQTCGGGPVYLGGGNSGFYQTIDKACSSGGSIAPAPTFFTVILARRSPLTLVEQNKSCESI